ADDEVAAEGLVRLRVVDAQALLAGPVTYGVADRVAQSRGQPAGLDRQHLVPSAGAMETGGRAFGRIGERILELVPVVERLVGREDRPRRGLTTAAAPLQRGANLGLPGLHLRLGGPVLGTAAAPRRGVDGRR